MIWPKLERGSATGRPGIGVTGTWATITTATGLLENFSTELHRGEILGIGGLSHGGTKNRLLNQFSADATHRTVVAGPVEATAIGKFLLQVITFGDSESLGAAHQVVGRSFEIEEYHPLAGEGWGKAFEKLNSLLERKD